ncbi:MAG: hypothetical protein LBH49_00955 [Puniceicoccales bacterium]|jgi:hypothetical protein|nr:hypothetical protein [Puniceicoccales bacterium]
MGGKTIAIILFVVGFAYDAIASKAMADSTKNPTNDSTKLLTDDQIKEIRNQKILMLLSRELTTKERAQINGLPNGSIVDCNNTRIMDLDSILYGLKRYIGEDRARYYKNISLIENKKKFLAELKNFFEKQPFQEFSTDPNAADATKHIPIGPEPEDVHNKNKTDHIAALMELAGRLEDNEPARHSLVVFIAMHEFRDIIAKSIAALKKLGTDKTDYHMVRFYFANNMDCRASTNDSHGNDIFLDFLTKSKYTFHTLPIFHDNALVDYFVGTASFTDEKFSAMFHEFGHSWYVYLRVYLNENDTYNDLKNLPSFENFKSSKLLREIFPMCKNPIFSKDDIENIIANEFKGNENGFIREYMKDAINKIFSKNCMNSIMKNVIPKDNKNNEKKYMEDCMRKIIDYIGSKFYKNTSRIDCMLNLLNAAAYNKIWSNAHEIAQVLGLDKIGNTVFINRLSDFDYSVVAKLPFRTAYYSGNAAYLVNPSTQKNIKQFKFLNLTTRTLTRIKELRDKNIETILPSENALRLLFVLHGRDFDDYKVTKQKNAHAIDRKNIDKNAAAPRLMEEKKDAANNLIPTTPEANIIIINQGNRNQEPDEQLMMKNIDLISMHTRRGRKKSKKKLTPKGRRKKLKQKRMKTKKRKHIHKTSETDVVVINQESDEQLMKKIQI